MTRALAVAGCVGLVLLAGWLFLAGSGECGSVGSSLDAAQGLQLDRQTSWADDPGRAPLPGERVRVEVLNASGAKGMASAATDYLRELGYDVVSFGNAAAFTDEPTRVVDRVGDTASARRVADALNTSLTVSLPDSDLYVDVSVLLGRDWRRPERTPVEPVLGRCPWWNPRRWFR